jgi:hypothetical protein
VTALLMIALCVKHWSKEYFWTWQNPEHLLHQPGNRGGLLRHFPALVL